MGTVCRKAVWGAALLLWLVPAAGHASSGKHGARIDSGSARGQRTVIVTLKPGRKDAVRNKLQRRGRNVYGDHTLVEALSVRVDDEGYSDLANDPDVESIVYDAPVTASGDWSWSDWSSFCSGRVWGDVVTTAFVTEEGAFLRGQIRMEETVELDLEPAPETTPSEAAQAESIASTPIVMPENLTDGTTRKIVRKKKEE